MSQQGGLNLHPAVFLPDFPAFQEAGLWNAKPVCYRFVQEEEWFRPAKWAFFSACTAKTLKNKGFHESTHALGLALLNSASKEKIYG